MCFCIMMLNVFSQKYELSLVQPNVRLTSCNSATASMNTLQKHFIRTYMVAQYGTAAAIPKNAFFWIFFVTYLYFCRFFGTI